MWPTTVTLLLATLVPIILLGAGGIIALRTALADRLAADLDSLADAKQRTLEQLGQRAVDTVELLATRTQVRRNLAALLAGDERVRDWLVDALLESEQAIDDLIWIGLSDLDGRVVVASDPSLVGRPFDPPTRWQPPAGDEVSSRVLSGATGPVWLVTAPLREQEAVAGRVVAVFDLDTVVQLMRADTDQQPGLTTCVSFRADDGALYPLVDPVGAALTDDTLRSCQPAELLLAVEGRTGSEVVAAVRTVEVLDWVVTVRVAREVLLAPVADATRLVLGATVVLLLLAALAAVLLAGRLTRPIRALTASSARLEAGEAQAEADEQAPGELGELAERFNAMTAALKASQQDLEQRYTDLELLAHAMAHDLKSPLTVVLGCLELLTHERVVRDEDRALLLERGAGSARRMQQLIDDLLLLIRTVGTEPAARPIPLEEVVDAVVEQLDATGWVHRGPLPVVAGDRVLLDHLLLNLLDNALTYSRPDQPPRIEVGASDDEAVWVELYVDDDGVGIPPEERAPALELFSRGERTRDRPGSGLGLPIAVRIVERHGGRLWIGDSPLGGTRIAFTLPRTADDEG